MPGRSFSYTDMHPFAGRKLLIATMHGKERAIGPILEAALGVTIVVPARFDSDRFGTFTGETARAGDQFEAARAKAVAAMADEGVDLAVASEGSFGAHPSVPFARSNLELMLLIDARHGHEIKGHHRTGETNLDGRQVANVPEAIAFAREIGFPEHGVIVRDSERGSRIRKDVRTEAELVSAVEDMLSGMFRTSAFIETDMRAHRNPTRMQAIARATEDLVRNIVSRCPQCDAPGFVAVSVETGLPCAACGRPSDLPRSEHRLCPRCQFSETRAVRTYGETADPRYCESCNP